MSQTPETVARLAIRVLQQQSAVFLEHTPGARTGHEPHDVHQMRVAARRMRAALRLFGDVLPSTEARHLNAELSWIAGQLGHVRDLDVQLRRLRETGLHLDIAEGLVPYGAWLLEQRRQAQRALSAALRSARFLDLVQLFRALAAWAPNPLTDAALASDAPRRLKRAYKALDRRASRLTAESPPPDFHQVRIRAKRLRYTAEFFAPTYGKAAQRLIKQLTFVQDLLGDLQDSVVGAERAHAAVRAVGSAWPAEAVLALGQVVQYDAGRELETRRAFRAVYREVVGNAWRRLASRVAIS